MRRCLIYMMVFCLAKLCWVVILISIFQMRKLNFGKRGNLPVVTQLGKDQNHASGPGWHILKPMLLLVQKVYPLRMEITTE